MSSIKPIYSEESVNQLKEVYSVLTKIEDKLENIDEFLKSKDIENLLEKFGYIKIKN